MYKTLKYATLFVLIFSLVAMVSAFKLQWYGQAAFELTAKDGTRVIIDPYKFKAFNGAFNYAEIKGPAEIVTISHNHDDHNGYEGIAGSPVVIQQSMDTTIKNIRISGTDVFHDNEKGVNRGKEIIFVYTIDNLRVCHVGDLGHVLTPEQRKSVLKSGPIDVLLIPVGEVYTLNLADVEKVISQLNPKLVIPMHYKTPKITIPLKLVDAFTKDRKNVIQRAVNTIEITDKTLPKERQIMVLQPAN